MFYPKYLFIQWHRYRGRSSIALSFAFLAIVLLAVYHTLAATTSTWRLNNRLHTAIASRTTILDGTTKSLYLFGGRTAVDQPLNSIYCSQESQGILLSDWTALSTNMPRGLYSQALVSTNKYIYLIGGWDGSQARNEVYRSQIMGNCLLAEWQFVNNFPSVIQTHDVVILTSQGRIYVIGGFDNHDPRNNIYFSQIQGDGNLSAWQETASLPVPLFLHSSVATANDIYVIGGYDNQSARSEIYRAHPNPDGTISQWEKLSAALPSARYYTEALIRGQSIIVIGGSNGTTRFADVLSYRINEDGTLQQETDLPPLTSVVGQNGARFRFGAALGTLSQIYVIGGMDENRNVHDEVYVLSPPPGISCAMSNNPVGILEATDIVTYTVTCSADAYFPVNLTITNPIPSGATFVTADNGGHLISDSLAQWDQVHLAPNQSVSVSYQLRANQDNSVIVSQPAEASWTIVNHASSQPDTGPVEPTNVVINGPTLFLPLVQR